MRRYTYRNLPCYESETNQIMPIHIVGRDMVDMKVGLLEWCRDEVDAHNIFERMWLSGEFLELEVKDTIIP